MFSINLSERPGCSFVNGIIFSAVLLFSFNCENSESSISLLAFKTQITEPAPGTKWTIIYYGDADNNLESALLEDVKEMKAGLIDGDGVNVIVLFDRIKNYSNDTAAFGENFEDTRIYRITNGRVWRENGSTQFPEITKSSSYEANMGDAATLRKFIQYCKANYPADNYALILSNHGGGARKLESTPSAYQTENSAGTAKAICYDTTSGEDFLYTSEISDTLTSSESVQLFGLDACLMSSAEFAYQFRNDSSNNGFKAEIMVASAPNVTGYGWDYESIFARLQSGGGDNSSKDITITSDTGSYASELYYDPAVMTAKEFGTVIVEEQRDSTTGDSSQSLSCLDLSKISAVKAAVDSMALSLSADNEKTDLEDLRGNTPAALLLHYFNASDIDEWVTYPFFDLYNLASAVNSSASFSSIIKAEAASVMAAVDAFVLYSFANSDYTTGYSADPFIAGKSGLHIFFPDGDYITAGYTKRNWWYQDWYNSLDLRLMYTHPENAPNGKLAWCIDGINPAVNTVGNWFELLDSWFDLDGGDNFYQW